MTIRTLLVLIWSILGATAASAHPHVWIVAKADMVFDEAGRLTAIRHRWTFDDGYSAFAVQGLDLGRDGKPTAAALGELARTNADSLAEFDYFTRLRTGSTKQLFGTVRDADMTLDRGELTLSFTLPLRAPAAVGRSALLDIFDPTFFVDFTLSSDADAVTAAGAPAGCRLDVTKPKPVAASAQTLSESFFTALDATSTYGSQFANRALLACP